LFLSRFYKTSKQSIIKKKDVLVISLEMIFC
jgi:hypothetical protein